MQAPANRWRLFLFGVFEKVGGATMGALKAGIRRWSGGGRPSGAPGGRRILFVHPSSRTGSSGNYLQALGSALNRAGAQCMMLGEGPGRGMHDGVRWLRFSMRRGCLSGGTIRRVRAFQPDCIVMVGVRVRSMLAALELRQILDLPFYVQFEDDDGAPFRAYYPDPDPRLLQLLDRPEPGEADSKAFVEAVDWPLTHRLWTGEGDFRSVEPVLRVLCGHLCDGATAIWQPLADDVNHRFGKRCRLMPPVVDCAALQPVGLAGGRRRNLLSAVGKADDRLVLFVSGTVYGFSREFEMFLDAVAMVARDMPLALLLAGRARLDVEQAMAARLPGDVPYANLGAPSWHRYLDYVRAADVICVPGMRDEFNRLRLPGRIPVAMALGKALFTFEHGFGASVEDGVEAMLTHEDSVVHWAEKLRVLADPGVRARLAAHGRAFAEREFDAKVTALRVLEILGETSQRANDLGFLAPLASELTSHWEKNGSAARMERVKGIEPSS